MSWGPTIELGLGEQNGARIEVCRLDCRGVVRVAVQERDRHRVPADVLSRKSIRVASRLFVRVDIFDASFIGYPMRRRGVLSTTRIAGTPSRGVMMSCGDSSRTRRTR